MGVCVCVCVVYKVAAKMAGIDMKLNYVTVTLCIGDHRSFLTTAGLLCLRYFQREILAQSFPFCDTGIRGFFKDSYKSKALCLQCVRSSVRAYVRAQAEASTRLPSSSSFIHVLLLKLA